MIEYRPLHKEDNIEMIADWIYQTDKIFDFIFKNKDNAVKAISKLIVSDYKNLYHRDFLTVASEENNILGILISYKGDDFDYSDIIHAFRDTGYSTYFRTHLFPVLDEILASYVYENEYYIGILYINPNFRNKHMGSKLVNHAIDKAKKLNCNCVKLDVESFKKTLPDYYSRFGFKIDSENFYRLSNNYNHNILLNIIAGICIKLYFNDKNYGCYGMKLDL